MLGQRFDWNERFECLGEELPILGVKVRWRVAAAVHPVDHPA
jgi:hypothetical protein